MQKLLTTKQIRNVVKQNANVCFSYTNKSTSAKKAANLRYMCFAITNAQQAAQAAQALQTHYNTHNINASVNITQTFNAHTRAYYVRTQALIA
jgi:hypothetical protein